MSIIFLRGERIHLRPLREEDLRDEYLQWLNDEEVCRYNSHAIFPYSHSQMKSYFQSVQEGSRSNVVLAIVDRQQETHIGNVSLQRIDWVARNAEFAILLGNKHYWSKGYATEASLLICRYGFIRLNLHRIYCGTSILNGAMRNLAAKLAMTQEGVRRQAAFKDGQYQDIVEYGVLRDEFFARCPKPSPEELPHPELP